MSDVSARELNCGSLPFEPQARSLIPESAAPIDYAEYVKKITNALRFSRDGQNHVDFAVYDTRCTTPGDDRDMGLKPGPKAEVT